MDSTTSGGFWDGLKSVGISTFDRLLVPVTNGLSQSFQNIVTGVQSKVADATSKIVSSTDPKRNANSPAIPPTTGSSANPALNRPAVSIGVLVAALGVILLVWYLAKGK